MTQPLPTAGAELRSHMQRFIGHALLAVIANVTAVGCVRHTPCALAISARACPAAACPAAACQAAAPPLACSSAPLLRMDTLERVGGADSGGDDVHWAAAVAAPPRA